jgi:pectinesterase
MRFNHPDQSIIDAINSAVAWLEESKIYGIHLERIKIDNRDISESYKRSDVKVVEDENAPPIWARYYEIDSNRPFFCNRDGIKVYNLDEVDQERRIGYAWYGYWPGDLLNSKYPEWIERVSKDESSIFPKDTSYTIYTTYNKLINEYPFITIVTPGNATNLVRYDNLIYKSYLTRSLHLDIYHPDTTRILPAVILIHCGGWVSGDRSLLKPLAEKIAETGFATILVEYRLAPETLYPAAIIDIKNAIKWIKKNSEKYFIDEKKIALLGTSAGGQIAALVGTTAGNKIYKTNYLDEINDDVQAIIDIDGVLDMTDPSESGKDSDPDQPSVGKRWLGYSYNENPEIWKEASPLNHVDDKSPPIEFINSSIKRFHAGRDEVIEKLKNYGIYYEIHTLPDSPHSFWLFDPWFDPTCSFIINFLQKVFL